MQCRLPLKGMIMTSTQLISEYLRPSAFSELAIPTITALKLQRMYETGEVMNMLFWGMPGTGKTSAAKIFERGNYDVLILNGSKENGIKEVRNTIERYASTVSFYNQPKILIIDEADYLSDSAQAALRNLVETVSDNCRFILTANHPDKLSRAIRSRFFPINFNLTNDQIPEISARVSKIIEKRLKERTLPLPLCKIEEIVEASMPDLREVANRLQFELA